MLAFATAAILALPLVKAGAISRPRGLEELWGGFNITGAALEIQASISSPGCNATVSCQDFVKKVIPQCLGLQGTAGCWCTLHDPLHFCAICMTAPTDNTTSSLQTQNALEGHTAYHRGCSAYQAYLNASAAGSLTTSMASTSAPLPTASAAAAENHGSHVNVGAIAGGAAGGVIILALIIAGTILLYRRMNNKHAVATAAARDEGVLGGGGAMEKEKPLGEPVRVTSYYPPGAAGSTQPFDMDGGPPPPPFVGHQSYAGSEISYSQVPHTPSQFSPMTLYPTSQAGYSVQNQNQNQQRDSMFSGAMSDAGSSSYQGGGSAAGYGASAAQEHGQALRAMGSSPPPPFTAGGYDASMLGEKGRR